LGTTHVKGNEEEDGDEEGMGMVEGLDDKGMNVRHSFTLFGFVQGLDKTSV
jgi:hypothetical protein